MENDIKSFLERYLRGYFGESDSTPREGVFKNFDIPDEITNEIEKEYNIIDEITNEIEKEYNIIDEITNEIEKEYNVPEGLIGPKKIIGRIREKYNIASEIISEIRKNYSILDKIMDKIGKKYNIPDETINEIKKGYKFKNFIKEKEISHEQVLCFFGKFFNYLDEKIAEKILFILPLERLEHIGIYYIPKNILKKLTEKEKDKKNLNILKSLYYELGECFKEIEYETTKKILKTIVDTDKIKKIKIEYIPNTVIEDLLKETKNGNIESLNVLKSLNYDLYNNYKYFEEIKEETIEGILKIIDDDKIKNFEINYIPNKVIKNLLEGTENEINILKLIKYREGYNFKKIDDEIVKKILETIVDTDKIKKIQIDYISDNIIKDLLKEAKERNSKSINILKSIDYTNGNYFKKIKDEEEVIEEILKIIDDDKIKEIKAYYIPKSLLEKCIEDPENNKELLNKISLLDFSSLEEKFYEIYENVDKEKFLNFLSILSNKNNANKILVNIKDEEILKKFLYNLDEEKLKNICFSDIDCDLFKKLVSNLENEEENKKILNLLDYSDVNEKNNIMDYIYDENNKEMTKKFLSFLGYERIKNLNTYSIIDIVKNNELKEFLEKKFTNKTDNLILQLNKKILLCKSDNNNIYEVEGVLSPEDIIKTIESNYLEKEDVKKINLKNDFSYGIDDIKKIIEELLDKCPEKLPIFYINTIGNELLFKCIKNGNLEIENLRFLKKKQKESINLSFLKTKNKFNTIKEIIKADNLFLKDENGNINFDNPQYNVNVLKKLKGILSDVEINNFARFYCESYENKIQFNSNKLQEILKNIKIENNFLEKIHKDYFNENNELERNSEKQYLLNRQENLYLSLMRLKENFEKRLEKLKDDEIKNNDEYNKNKEDFDTRRAEIKSYLKKINSYINYLSNFRNNEEDKNMAPTDQICDPEEAKEILNFTIERYSEEVLRRKILDYQERVKPFVKDNFEKEEAKKITREIKEALSILYNPYSPNDSKLEAQKILKENLEKIGEKYKSIAEEKGIKVSGDYIMLSSICCSENSIEDINNAIYSEIRIKIANGYITKLDDVYAGIEDNILYRGLTGEDLDKNKVSTEQMSNPNALTGKPKFGPWDITNKNNMLNSKGKISGQKKESESWIASFTSYSPEAATSIGIYGGGGIISCYCIPENLKKAFSSSIGYNSEIKEAAGYDVPLDYRMFAIISNDTVLKGEDLNGKSKDDAIIKVENVKFNEKMDFVIFRLNLNLKEDLKINYKDNKGNDIEETFNKNQKNLTVTKEQLGAIIKTLGERGELIPFLRDQLAIERVFDKNKVLGEEFKDKKEEIKKDSDKTNKFLRTEKGVKTAQKRFKPFNVVENDNDKNDKINNLHMFAIPDVHGDYNMFVDGLKNSGIVEKVEENEFIYYKKDDYKLENPIYKEPENYSVEDEYENEYIRIPKLVLNNNIETPVIQLGDLVDSHIANKDNSLECVVTSILLSRQTGNKYTTLVGNHEIANIVDIGYYGGRNNACKNFILEAIKNGEIKLMSHIPGTNIINSHVPLIKDNILNFLNNIILKNEQYFKSSNDEINRLIEIIGGIKGDKGYKIDDDKCLLNKKPPKEKDLRDFVNIINKLFVDIVMSENKELTKGFLGSLVNGNRLYINDSKVKYAKKLYNEETKQPLSPEELGELTFKGVSNIVGHDATANGKKFGEKEYGKKQKQYLTEARIGFTDEHQGLKCVGIGTDEKGKINCYFDRGDGYKKNDFIDEKKEETELPSISLNELKVKNISKELRNFAKKLSECNEQQKKQFEIMEKEKKIKSVANRIEKSKEIITEKEIEDLSNILENLNKIMEEKNLEDLNNTIENLNKVLEIQEVHSR